MKIAFLMTDGFDDREFRQPYDRLLAAGHELHVVGPDPTATLLGKMGRERVPVDVGLDSADPEQYDGVVVPGGHSPDRLRILPRAVAFVAAVHARGRLTAAICHGPWLLIEAGLVRGRRLTGWASVRTDVINAGGLWVDAPVVHDEHLITSRRPEDLPEFGDALVHVLAAVPAAAQA